MKRFPKSCLSITLFLLGCFALRAQDTSGRFNLHFQTTYVYQYKPAFHAPYSGPNSLSGADETQNSVTATLYLGAHLWKGAEFYLNPEIAGGSGLSGALGMGGSSNGETFRVGNPSPTLYLARAFLVQHIGLGTKTETVDDDANQLAGLRAQKRLDFYLGKYSLGDLFDNNEYANSPRTQFLNWALMNCGAWDYAANVRGYTYAFTTSLVLGETTIKAGAATLPVEANGAKLNTHFRDSFALALNAELDHAHHLRGHAGNLRLCLYRNEANMGSYAQAIRTAGRPDITATRRFGRTKWGALFNFDQELSKTAGLFGRAGWNDGRNESWAFTEIDRTITLGLSFDGARWKRTGDKAGIALAVNGLSKDHRRYLAHGGAGFIVGDGALDYAPERIGEFYYSFRSVSLPLWLTGDYQFCANPGYNKDRGPVHIFSLRVHTDF